MTNLAVVVPVVTTDDTAEQSTSQPVSPAEPAPAVLTVVPKLAPALLNYVVLWTEETEKLLTFYGALGLTFGREKHAGVPWHYASEVDGRVLEIYPSRPGTPTTPWRGGEMMIGFSVVSLDATLAELEKVGFSSETVVHIQEDFGRHVIVRDPDGRQVLLVEPPPKK